VDEDNVKIVDCVPTVDGDNVKIVERVPTVDEDNVEIVERVPTVDEDNVEIVEHVHTVDEDNVKIVEHVAIVDEDNVEIVDSEDEVEQDNPLNVTKELANSRSINNSTCILLSHGPDVPANQVLNLAPGEGQIPTSVTKEPQWEAMAFPKLFPTGEHTYHTTSPRITTLWARKYINARPKTPGLRKVLNMHFSHWIGWRGKPSVRAFQSLPARDFRRISQ
jgi:hypothetical protein